MVAIIVVISGDTGDNYVGNYTGNYTNDSGELVGGQGESDDGQGGLGDTDGEDTLDIFANNSNLDNSSIVMNNEDPVIIYSDNIELRRVDNMHEEFSEDEDRIEISRYIAAGKKGVYRINNKDYVILSSGGKSESEIEYTLDSDLDGNIILEWRFSFDLDGECKIRYIVFETNNTNITIREYKDLSALSNGLVGVILFRYGADKVIYNTDKRVLETYNDIRNMPGLYMAEYEDGKIIKLSEIDFLDIYECEVIELVPNSRMVYTVKLATGVELPIQLKEERYLQPGDKLDILLFYEYELDIFTGVVSHRYT